MNLLRLPLAILVVFVHNSYEYPVVDSNECGYIVYEYIKTLMGSVLGHLAVPTFFLISGYYFFYRFKKFEIDDYERKLNTRIHTLLIPFLIWNLMEILLMIGIQIKNVVLTGSPWQSIFGIFHNHGLLDVFWNYHNWGSRPDIISRTPSCSTGPILLPTWYLRDLLVLMAFAPFVYFLIRKIKITFIVILLCSYITGQVIFQIPGVGSILFFSLGAYLSINGKSIIDTVYRYRNIAYIFTILLLIPLVYYKGYATLIGSLLYPFFILAGVLSLVSMAISITMRRTFEIKGNVNGLSFFIFLSHPFVLPLCYKLVMLLRQGGTWFTATLCHLIVPFVCVVILIGIYLFLEKKMPRLLSVLVGGRIK